MLSLETIPISTKTIIASSNLEIDIERVFRTFPCGMDMETVSGEEIDRNMVCFETLYYGTEIRGKEDKKRRKMSFRNAINVVGRLWNDKKINFKVSKNGKFQLTGCKEDSHAFLMIEHFILKMRQYCPSECVHLKEDDSCIRISFRTVMTNIDFSIGFLINRLKLDELINKEASVYSLLETSCGYTGVNIKFPVDYAYWKDPIPIMECEWDPTKGPFRKSITLGYEDNVRVPSKQRFNTFLAFHSGNIIMSGMNIDSMRNHFHLFQKMLLEWKPLIEEKII